MGFVDSAVAPCKEACTPGIFSPLLRWSCRGGTTVFCFLSFLFLEVTKVDEIKDESVSFAAGTVSEGKQLIKSHPNYTCGCPVWSLGKPSFLQDVRTDTEQTVLCRAAATRNVLVEGEKKPLRFLFVLWLALPSVCDYCLIVQGSFISVPLVSSGDVRRLLTHWRPAVAHVSGTVRADEDDRRRRSFGLCIVLSWEDRQKSEWINFITRPFKRRQQKKSSVSHNFLTPEREGQK